MTAPTTAAAFDRAYRLPFTPWGDFRIPSEVVALATRVGPSARMLELGCGRGRFTRYLARRGLSATGVDFSPVAIELAQRAVAADEVRPTFLVADVTQPQGLAGPFDAALDVGCFHCLDPAGQRAYATEVAGLLAPGATLLLWALDRSPAGATLGPAAVAAA